MKQISKQVFYGAMCLGLLASPVLQAATPVSNAAAKPAAVQAGAKATSTKVSTTIRFALPNTLAFRSVRTALANKTTGEIKVFLGDHSAKTIKNPILASLTPVQFKKVTNDVSNLVKQISRGQAVNTVFANGKATPAFIDNVTNIAIEKKLFGDKNSGLLGVITGNQREITRNDIRTMIDQYTQLQMIPQYTDVDTLMAGMISMDDIFDMASHSMSSWTTDASGNIVYTSAEGDVLTTTTFYKDGSYDVDTVTWDSHGKSSEEKSHHSSFWSRLLGDEDSSSSDGDVGPSEEGSEGWSTSLGQGGQITAESEVGRTHHIIVNGSDYKGTGMLASFLKDTDGHLKSMLSQVASKTLDKAGLQKQFNSYLSNKVTSMNVKGVQVSVSRVRH